jgi:hypothetical protein
LEEDKMMKLAAVLLVVVGAFGEIIKYLLVA